MVKAGVDKALAALRAAGEPTRLRILALLREGERSVKDLTDILGQSQPRISRHLKLLSEAGLVERHPEGTWAFFRLADSGAGSGLNQHLLEALDFDDPVLARDRERLDAVRASHAALAADYFSRHAAGWDEMRAMQAPEGAVEAAIAEIVPQRIGRLVDLGTGTGRVLELLAPRAAHLTGIDINHDMLHYARSRLEREGLRHAQLRQGDVYNPPVEAGTADVVVLHQVLHFLDDPARAIHEAARLLKKGGLAVIVDLKAHEREALREAHAHRRLGFTNEQIGGWMREAGIEAGEPREIAGPDADSLTVTIWTGKALNAARRAGAAA
ncbi:MAG: ArsR/SmtB family transcription factor [Flavobacteriaceae bacterium]